MIAIDSSNLIYVACYMNKLSDNLNDYKASIDNYLGAILSITQSSEYICFLDKTSFRSSFYKEYKGNRVYNYIKFKSDLTHWCINERGFVVIDGLEADDLVRITKDIVDTDIVGVDKDLDQIEGTYWKYSKGEYQKLTITKEQAEFNLYKQILVGDKTDNIKGIDGIGPIKAEAYLKDCLSKGISLQQATINAFLNGINKKPTKLFPQTLEDFTLTYKLVKLLTLNEIEAYGFNKELVTNQIRNGIQSTNPF